MVASWWLAFAGSLDFGVWGQDYYFSAANPERETVFAGYTARTTHPSARRLRTGPDRRRPSLALLSSI